MAATDAVAGPLTPPGFYYTTVIRARRLWPMYERALRKASGFRSSPTCARAEVDSLGVPSHCVTVTKETKPQAEGQALELLASRSRIWSASAAMSKRVVLSRAPRSHLDDRVLVHEGRTIVF